MGFGTGEATKQERWDEGKRVRLEYLIPGSFTVRPPLPYRTLSIRVLVTSPSPWPHRLWGSESCAAASPRVAAFSPVTPLYPALSLILLKINSAQILIRAHHLFPVGTLSDADWHCDFKSHWFRMPLGKRALSHTCWTQNTSYSDTPGSF